MRRTELISEIAEGREITKPAGLLAVLIAQCPTCGSEAGVRCVAYTWPDRRRSNQVHPARREAAIGLIQRGAR